MSTDYGRIHRLLRILTLIQSQPGWSAARLAEECGTSVRTIYRDMKMLEGAGIPYFHDAEAGGYGVRRDFFMPPVQLTLDESLAMVALAEHIGGKEQVPLMRAAGRAVAKVRSVMPAAIRDELAGLDKHLSIRLGQAGPFEGIEDVYETVRRAILQRRALSCVYESAKAGSNGEDEAFEFRPYTLLFAQRSWYAVGWHCGRDALRKLKLNRFVQIQATTHPYPIPEDFSLDKELGNAWRMIRGDKSYDVELRFDAEFAETIADTAWHRTQQTQWHDDGSMTFTCTVDGLDEIVWWVLSMGPHCRVIKPKALASRTQKLAQQTAALYG